jgi:hypothetical protein
VRLGQGERITAMVGLGERPTSNRDPIGCTEPIDQLRITRLADPRRGQPAEPERDRQSDRATSRRNGSSIVPR